MTDIQLKVVPMRSTRKVPEDAKPIDVEALVGRLADRVTKLADVQEGRLELVQKLVYGFRKDLSDLKTCLDFTEARLNRVIRLAKTLALKAGVLD